MSVKTQKGNDAPLRPLVPYNEQSIVVTSFKDAYSNNTRKSYYLYDILDEIKKPTIKQVEFQKQLYTLYKTDKAKYKKLKTSLKFIKFQGLFTNLKAESIVKHNQLILLDIDNFDSNHELVNCFNWFNSNPFTLFVFVSPSGNGLKVAIKTPEIKVDNEHINIIKDEYKRRVLAFQETMPKEFEKYIDKASYKLSQGCFIAYDKNCYINLDADTFTGIKEIVKPNSKTTKTTHVFKGVVNSCIDITELCNKIEFDNVDLSDDDYNTYLQIGFAFSDEFGESGRGYFHQVVKGGLKYNYDDVNKQYDECLKSTGSGTTIGTFFHLAKEKGYQLSFVKQQKKQLIEKSKNIVLNDFKPIKYKLKQRFIGQDNQAVSILKKAIKDNKTTTLISTQGSGKTSVLNDLFNTTLKDEFIVVIAPTEVLAKQIGFDLSVTAVTGGISEYERVIALKQRIIVTTYHSLKRIDIKNKILVIDEYDHMVRSDYQTDENPTDVCTRVFKAVELCKKAILMSGTNDFLIDYHVKSKLIEFDAYSEPLKVNTIGFYKESLIDNVIDYLIKIKRNKGGKHLLQIDNKEVLLGVNNRLTKLGYNSDVIYSDDEIEKGLTYNKIVSDKIIDDHLDFVLTTCKINEGISLYNTDIKSVSIVINSHYDFNDNKHLQWFKRPRKSKEYDINIFYNVPRKSGLNNSDIDVDELLKNEQNIKISLFKDLYSDVLKEFKNMQNNDACFFGEQINIDISTSRIDKYFTTLNSISGGAKTFISLPTLMSQINNEFFKGFSNTNYIEFLIKKSNFLSYNTDVDTYLLTEVNKETKEVKKEVAEYSKKLINLIKENEYQFIKSVSLDLKDRGLTDAVNSCYGGYSKELDIEQSSGLIDLFKSFNKYIDAKGVLKEFLFFRKMYELDITINLLNELYDISSSKSKLKFMKKTAFFYWFLISGLNLKDIKGIDKQRFLKRLMYVYNNIKIGRKYSLKELKTIVDASSYFKLPDDELKPFLKLIFSVNADKNNKGFFIINHHKFFDLIDVEKQKEKQDKNLLKV